MVPSAAASTNREEEAPTTKSSKPEVDEEKIITIPRVLQWIMAASSSLPPALTIEEVDRKLGKRRGGFWLCAVCIPPLCIGAASLMAYKFHRGDHIFPRRAPWRAPAIVAWGVYMALVVELFFVMSLFLPRAPCALRDAVAKVLACGGGPLVSIVILAACVGHTWMGVVLACVYAVLFTAIIAFWVWLVRTYT